MSGAARWAMTRCATFKSPLEWGFERTLIGESPLEDSKQAWDRCLGIQGPRAAMYFGSRLEDFADFNCGYDRADKECRARAHKLRGLWLCKLKDVLDDCKLNRHGPRDAAT